MRRALRRVTRIPVYRAVVRPLLFGLQPERALHWADAAFAVRPLWRAHAFALDMKRLAQPASIAGIPLRNRVGLAAGLDKNCRYVASLRDLGFGYVTVGTVTRAPRKGNRRPRLLRRTRERALLNAMGFPNDGVDRARQRLARAGPGAPVLASIAALGDDDTAACIHRLQDVVDGFELNVSSPNTAGVREYQEPEALRRLLGVLNARRTRPLFVKLPPFESDATRDGVLALVRVCREAGADGVTYANTRPEPDANLAMGTGGLSGRPLFASLLAALPEVRQALGPDLALNACGGIASADDARAALGAGADTVQLYTALVYEGPRVVADIAEGLAGN